MTFSITVSTQEHSGESYPWQCKPLLLFFLSVFANCHSAHFYPGGECCSICMSPFQGMCYYWVCSSLFGLGQSVMFKMPSVRRLLRLPKTPSESETPFTDMYNAAKLKYVLRPKQKDSWCCSRPNWQHRGQLLMLLCVWYSCGLHWNEIKQRAELINNSANLLWSLHQDKWKSDFSVHLLYNPCDVCLFQLWCKVCS